MPPGRARALKGHSCRADPAPSSQDVARFLFQRSMPSRTQLSFQRSRSCAACPFARQLRYGARRAKVRSRARRSLRCAAVRHWSHPPGVTFLRFEDAVCTVPHIHRTVTSRVCGPRRSGGAAKNERHDQLLAASGWSSDTRPAGPRDWSLRSVEGPPQPPARKNS